MRGVARNGPDDTGRPRLRQARTALGRRITAAHAPRAPPAVANRPPAKALTPRGRSGRATPRRAIHSRRPRPAPPLRLLGPRQLRVLPQPDCSLLSGGQMLAPFPAVTTT